MTIEQLDAAPEAAAAEALERCCGASAWVRAMLASRPFATAEGLHEAADACAAALEERDWLEAFSHHPRIGDVASLRAKFASTAQWAGGEQAGAAAADDATLHALAKGNDDYFARFGFIFIVCATGLTASEMLARLDARLPHERAEELRIAAAEQNKITHLRLEKLLREDA